MSHNHHHHAAMAAAAPPFYPAGYMHLQQQQQLLHQQHQYRQQLLFDHGYVESEHRPYPLHHHVQHHHSPYMQLPHPPTFFGAPTTNIYYPGAGGVPAPYYYNPAAPLPPSFYFPGGVRSAYSPPPVIPSTATSVTAGRHLPAGPAAAATMISPSAFSTEAEKTHAMRSHLVRVSTPAESPTSDAGRVIFALVVFHLAQVANSDEIRFAEAAAMFDSLYLPVAGGTSLVHNIGSALPAIDPHGQQFALGRFTCTHALLNSKCNVLGFNAVARRSDTLTLHQRITPILHVLFAGSPLLTATTKCSASTFLQDAFGGSEISKDNRYVGWDRLVYDALVAYVRGHGSAVFTESPSSSVLPTTATSIATPPLPSAAAVSVAAVSDERQSTGIGSTAALPLASAAQDDAQESAAMKHDAVELNKVDLAAAVSSHEQLPAVATPAVSTASDAARVIFALVVYHLSRLTRAKAGVPLTGAAAMFDALCLPVARGVPLVTTAESLLPRADEVSSPLARGRLACTSDLINVKCKLFDFNLVNRCRDTVELHRSTTSLLHALFPARPVLSATTKLTVAAFLRSALGSAEPGASYLAWDRVVYDAMTAHVDGLPQQPPSYLPPPPTSGTATPAASAAAAATRNNNDQHPSTGSSVLAVASPRVRLEEATRFLFALIVRHLSLSVVSGNPGAATVRYRRAYDILRAMQLRRIDVTQSQTQFFFNSRSVVTGFNLVSRTGESVSLNRNVVGVSDLLELIFDGSPLLRGAPVKGDALEAALGKRADSADWVNIVCDKIVKGAAVIENAANMVSSVAPAAAAKPETAAAAAEAAPSATKPTPPPRPAAAPNVQIFDAARCVFALVCWHVSIIKRLTDVPLPIALKLFHEVQLPGIPLSTSAETLCQTKCAWFGGALVHRDTGDKVRLTNLGWQVTPQLFGACSIVSKPGKELASGQEILTSILSLANEAGGSHVNSAISNAAPKWLLVVSEQIARVNSTWDEEEWLNAEVQVEVEGGGAAPASASNGSEAHQEPRREQQQVQKQTQPPVNPQPQAASAALDFKKALTTAPPPPPPALPPREPLSTTQILDAARCVLALMTHHIGKCNNAAPGVATFTNVSALFKQVPVLRDILHDYSAPPFHVCGCAALSGEPLMQQHGAILRLTPAGDSLVKAMFSGAANVVEATRPMSGTAIFRAVVKALSTGYNSNASSSSSPEEDWAHLVYDRIGHVVLAQNDKQQRHVQPQEVHHHAHEETTGNNRHNNDAVEAATARKRDEEQQHQQTSNRLALEPEQLVVDAQQENQQHEQNQQPAVNDDEQDQNQNQGQPQNGAPHDDEAEQDDDEDEEQTALRRLAILLVVCRVACRAQRTTAASAGSRSGAALECILEDFEAMTAAGNNGSGRFAVLSSMPKFAAFVWSAEFKRFVAVGDDTVSFTESGKELAMRLPLDRNVTKHETVAAFLKALTAVVGKDLVAWARAVWEEFC